MVVSMCLRDHRVERGTDHSECLQMAEQKAVGRGVSGKEADFCSSEGGRTFLLSYLPNRGADYLEEVSWRWTSTDWVRGGASGC